LTLMVTSGLDRWSPLRLTSEYRTRLTGLLDPLKMDILPSNLPTCRRFWRDCKKGHLLRIGVISDTHVRTFGEIPEPILIALAEVDLIVHTGDFTERAVLEGLRTLGEVKAVYGNMDSGEVRRMLPHKEVFVVNGKRIGLTHGSGGSWGIARRVREMFSDVALIIYGHSHEPYNQFVRGSLLFNPGRARDSYGLLTIDDEIKAEIIRV